MKSKLDLFHTKSKNKVISQARPSSIKSDTEEQRKQKEKKKLKQNHFAIILNKLANISEYVNNQKKFNIEKDKGISNQLKSLSELNKFPLKNIQEELERNHEKVDSIDEKINKLIEMQVNFKEKPRKNIEISSNIMNENSIKSHTKFKPLHLIKLCKSDADLNYCKINKESLRNFAKSFREFKNEYNILKQETNERLWEGIQKIDNLRTHLNNIYNLSNNLNRFKEFSNKIYEKDELPVKIINIESNKSIEEDLINFQQESNKNLEIVGDELINKDKNNNIMNQRQKLNQHFESPIKKPLLKFLMMNLNLIVLILFQDQIIIASHRN